MTKKQIEYLRIIGYVDTIKDGAILEHPEIQGIAGYVWKDQSFEDILSKLFDSITYSVKCKALGAIRGIQ